MRLTIQPRLKTSCELIVMLTGHICSLCWNCPCLHYKCLSSSIDINRPTEAKSVVMGCLVDDDTIFSVKPRLVFWGFYNQFQPECRYHLSVQGFHMGSVEQKGSFPGLLCKHRQNRVLAR